MKNLVIKFILKIKGQALVEYGFILMLVALVLIGAIILLGKGLLEFFKSFSEMIP